MNLIAKLLLAGSIGVIGSLAADCGDQKPVPNRSAPLITSDVKTDRAAMWATEVVRATAASDPAITDRHGAHISTRMGDMRGGGMVTYASCKQKFDVSDALAGGGKEKEREVEYSFLERAVGGPLPRPTRPIAKGEKVVLVLGVDAALIKVIPDAQENRKEIAAIAAYVKARPAAAQALLKSMNTITLKLEYHGPKADVHPSVWFTTRRELPAKIPAKWIVEQNLSQGWAYQAVDHLMKAGTLKPESIDAERKRPRPTEPFYTLTLSAAGVDELTFHLGWAKEAHARIEALGRAMEYDRGPIAKLLAKLKDEEEKK